MEGGGCVDVRVCVCVMYAYYSNAVHTHSCVKDEV